MFQNVIPYFYLSIILQQMLIEQYIIHIIKSIINILPHY